MDQQVIARFKKLYLIVCKLIQSVTIKTSLEVGDEILETAKDLELEFNKDDIEELIMEQEDQLIECLQNIVKEQYTVPPPEEEEHGKEIPHLPLKEF